jgi:IS5 family transposase
MAYLHRATMGVANVTDPAVALWQAKVRHYQPLIERVIAQSERRVLVGQPVPTRDKLVNLFEPHADIIIKGSREVHYGHKLRVRRRSPTFAGCCRSLPRHRRPR